MTCGGSDLLLRFRFAYNGRMTPMNGTCGASSARVAQPIAQNGLARKGNRIDSLILCADGHVSVQIQRRRVAFNYWFAGQHGERLQRCLAAFLTAICALTGCSTRSVAPAPTVSAGVVNAKTNAHGEMIVQLSISNAMPRSVFLGVRSVIHHSEGGWLTNYSDRPRFVGLDGPGSVASDLTLGARIGTIITLSPMKVTEPFRLEFVCFPQRVGVAGMADKANDKFRTWKEGSPHEGFLGKSFYVVTPIP
jgi:hypothetical protein